MSSRQSKPKLRPIDPEFWTVENELPDPIPVSTAELDAIERYFGGLFDAVFDARPRALPAAITASQKGEKR
jgi:hypothetical protein